MTQFTQTIASRSQPTVPSTCAPVRRSRSSAPSSRVSVSLRVAFSSQVQASGTGESGTRTRRRDLALGGPFRDGFDEPVRNAAVAREDQ